MMHTHSSRINWLAAPKKSICTLTINSVNCWHLRIGALLTLLTWRALESSLPLKTPQVCDQPRLSWNPLLSSSRNHPPRWADHPNLARDSRPKYAPYPYFSEVPSNSVFPCILWVTLKYNGEDELSGIFCYPNKPTPVDTSDRGHDNVHDILWQDPGIQLLTKFWVHHGISETVFLFCLKDGPVLT